MVKLHSAPCHRRAHPGPSPPPPRPAGAPRHRESIWLAATASDGHHAALPGMARRLRSRPWERSPESVRPASSRLRREESWGGWLLVLGHFLVLAVGAGARHLGGQSGFYDLGVMDNIVWQTVHGRLFFYPQYGMSYFGDHFAVILFLFVPLYAIWAHPLILVGGQALALAMGSLFVHRIALVHLARDGGADARLTRRAA